MNHFTCNFETTWNLVLIVRGGMVNVSGKIIVRCSRQNYRIWGTKDNHEYLCHLCSCFHSSSLMSKIPVPTCTNVDIHQNAEASKSNLPQSHSSLRGHRYGDENQESDWNQRTIVYTSLPLGRNGPFRWRKYAEYTPLNQGRRACGDI